MSSVYHLHSKKIAFWADPALVFRHVFAPHAYSFWLDSALLMEGMARFSFMGAIQTGQACNTQHQNSHHHLYHSDSFPVAVSGQLSRWIYYSVREKKLRCQCATGAYQEVEKSVFTFLQEESDNRQHLVKGDHLPFAFDCGWVGYFGYELKGELSGVHKHGSSLPDAGFMQTDRAVAFDHQTQEVYLLCLLESSDTEKNALLWFAQMEARLQYVHTHLPDTASPAFVHQTQDLLDHLSIKQKLVRSERGYLADIALCQQKIHAGESYEICLTNKLEQYTNLDPLTYYLAMRPHNPAPYAAFLRFQHVAIACFSPERFLCVRKDQQGRAFAESRPMKGTIGRSADPAKDQALLQQLQHSVKDRAENLMIVDLVRNDLGMVCQTGAINVSKLMAVETFAKVHQMISKVCGQLKPEYTAVDCIKALFPPGSMTGAPKVRTMEIIDQLESQARGVYSGALGYLGFNGQLDLNVVIRTAIFSRVAAYHAVAGSPNQQNPCFHYKMTLGTGGAITALSSPEQEFAEILLKIHALYV